MKVEVRPLDIEKWHKKKGKESFARPKVIKALYDTKLGGYATGLTDAEVEEYGKKLGVDLNNKFDPEEEHPVWDSRSYSVILENSTQFFNTTSPKEFILVKIMKSSKQVANSIKEWEDGLWPDATHVIFDEEEEVEIKASKEEIITKCYQKMAAITDNEKISIIQILGEKSVRGRSPSFITAEIGEIIRTKPKELLDLLEVSKEQRYAKSTVLEAIDKNILIKDGSNIKWLGDIIANSLEDAVDWILDPNNQTIKGKILEQLKK